MIEKTNADNSQIASVNFVKVPYQTISDSTIHITDAEIQTYLDDHKNQFAQEESRAISYISFSAAPTSGDSAAIFQQVQSLKPEFAATKDVESFLAKNGTEKNYTDALFLSQNCRCPQRFYFCFTHRSCNRTLSGWTQLCIGQNHGYQNPTGFCACTSHTGCYK